METTIQQHQKELSQKLWNMANALRGNMEAYEFKNYILGMIFYYYLSDRTERYMENLLKDDGISYSQAWADAEYKDAVVEESLRDLGFVIEPQYLFRNLVKMVENRAFDIEFLQKAINALMESTIGNESQADFEGLFSDMQLDSTKLGHTVRDRSAVMAKIVAALDEIDIQVENTAIDILGNAYEYLIGQFAATAGKKAGEFYTPAGPAELLCRLACLGLTDVKAAADPTCGSGSLLLRLKNYANVRLYYGQELTSTTYNLARMNMILRGVPYRNFNIYNGDTLEHDYFDGLKFRVQVANPPYSANWSADNKFLEDDRFSQYGKLAPKSKADFAFVQHMVHHMDEDGRAVVLLPHGALFRGGSEETIRRYLIENLNVIDAVIGLPANLFFGTGIPVCVLVLKNNRGANRNNILFIDASNDYERGKKQNILRSSDIDRIIDAYETRGEIDRYSHVATMEEIAANNFQLNILAYVKLNQVESGIDIPTQLRRLEEIDKEVSVVDERLNAMLQTIGAPRIGADTAVAVSTGRLRFKKADGTPFAPWQNTLLSDVLTERGEKNTGDLRVCSVAVKKGVVDQVEHLGRSFAAANTDNYNLVSYGDVVYTKSPTGDFPYGIVKQSQMDENVVVSPLYGVYIPKNYYVGYLIHSYFMYPANANNYLAPIIQKGAKNTINISNETFISKTIPLPVDEEEQRMVAEFLQLFDEKIALEIERGTVWENYKKGVFASMFVQE